MFFALPYMEREHRCFFNVYLLYAVHTAQHPRCVSGTVNWMYSVFLLCYIYVLACGYRPGSEIKALRAAQL